MIINAKERIGAIEIIMDALDKTYPIIEEENLNEDETRLLENSSSRILEVIKRDDRLDKIARDIAHHFPRRGFLGKGMVVSVDKYTAVKMYDKDDQPKTRVKSAIERSLNANLPDSYDAESFRSKIDLLMNHFVDMAVQGYGWIGSVA